MKKKFLLLFSTLAIVGFSASAQEVSFGLKAGMTGTNLKYSNEVLSATLKTKIGWYAGVMAEIGVADNFSVQPELLYSMMGAKVNGGTIAGIDFEGGKDELGYVSLPVLLKYKSEGLGIFVGPQIGLLLSAKSKSGGESEDFKDEVKSTDFSGVFGASYTLPNGFGLDARYQLGFVNIEKDPDPEVNSSVKNKGFMVGIHYFFNRQ